MLVENCLTLFLAIALADGRSLPHVFHGHETKPNQYPWVVDLYTAGSLCGAVLVRVNSKVEESDVVVTAAHCASQCINDKENSTEPCKWKPKPVSVVLVTAGSHNLDKEEVGEVQKTAAAIKVHPDWDHNVPLCSNLTLPVTSCFVNDIAVIKTSSPIKFTDTIRPIDLPQQDAQFDPTACVLAGWGYFSAENKASANLLSTDITALSPEICAKHWNDDPTKFGTMFCAAGDENSTSCRGDSGSPLWCKNKEGEPVLQGVVSGGERNCVGTRPSLFTKVAKFANWERKAVQELTSVRS